MRIMARKRLEKGKMGQALKLVGRKVNRKF